MGGAVGIPCHYCPIYAICQHATKLIANLPDEYHKESHIIFEEELAIAESAWSAIAHDKLVLSRFYDVFFSLLELSGDISIASAHGTGLKTKSKFIVSVFSDFLKILRSGNQKAIEKAAAEKYRSCLLERGLRVPQYIIVGQVMLRCFEETENPYWNEESRMAWRKIVSLVVKLVVRVGLRVEAELSAEELVNIVRKALNMEETPRSDDIKIDRSKHPRSNSIESTDSDTSAESGSTVDATKSSPHSSPRNVTPSSSPASSGHEPTVTSRVPPNGKIIYDDSNWENKCELWN